MPDTRTDPREAAGRPPQATVTRTWCWPFWHEESISSIQYVRDPRTDLCFAMLGSTTYTGYVVTSITHVPCERMPR
jgi:hypothetical protein